MLNHEEQDRKMSQLIAKCWADEGFKQRLLADPAAVLKAEGVELPGLSGRSIKVLTDDDRTVHLVIPANPAALSDQDLDQVAGGGIGNFATLTITGDKRAAPTFTITRAP